VKPTNTILHQAGVIAYRIRRRRLQVLLVTSRDTGRWIIPKGNVKAGMTPAEAAQQEAFEEAGVRGRVATSTPLGMYSYSKEIGSGDARAATVEVHLLEVEEQLKRWPERGERKRVWVTAKKAAGLVEEPELVSLLLKLIEGEGDFPYLAEISFGQKG
jgi:8-oxo-dGTP pyrophosphatase MutT (NUDIX family)